MCPFSMLAQVLLLLVGVVLLTTMAATLNGSAWLLHCQPKHANISMYGMINVTCTIQGPEKVYSEHMLAVQSLNSEVAEVKKEIWLKNDHGPHYFPESFTINGVFMGETNVSVQIRQRDNMAAEAEEEIKVTVIKKWTTLDSVFHVSVISLVTLMYINFGCAFNWGALRENLRRPYAPLIGFAIQNTFMPLISFLLGRYLLPGNTPMQLGLFFTGIAPSGGASNMWTLLLGGNLDLSLTITTMSTLFAFGTMPMWAFTLGHVIYAEGDMPVPYRMIVNYALCLVLPLLIGFLIQRFCSRVSQFLVRILKCLSAALLAFIIIFAIIVNTYIFELFSWRIVLAAMGLPWLGYTLAYISALLLGRTRIDALTIAIETGIQNTGIPIYILKNTLPPPVNDLTTVVPVAVATMTPLPLLGLYLYKLIRNHLNKKESKKDSRNLMDSSPLNSPMSELHNDNNFNVTGPKVQQAKLKLDDNYFTSMDLQCNI